MNEQRSQGSGELELTPEMAKDWLIGSGRAEESGGCLSIKRGDDSLGRAALAIFRGGEPQLLAKAYERVAGDPVLSDSVLEKVTRAVVEDYGVANATS